jgi:hypothetical protein
MTSFETGLAPRYFECSGNVKVLKLNSTSVHTIKEMRLSDCKGIQIESSLPLVGLKTLTTCTQSSFAKFVYIEKLYLCARRSDSWLTQHRLRCLPNLRELDLKFDFGGNGQIL